MEGARQPIPPLQTPLYDGTPDQGAGGAPPTQADDDGTPDQGTGDN
jgi:hypothetical protein